MMMSLDGIMVRKDGRGKIEKRHLISFIDNMCRIEVSLLFILSALVVFMQFLGSFFFVPTASGSGGGTSGKRPPTPKCVTFFLSQFLMNTYLSAFGGGGGGGDWD
jgi:hypothetical protein